MTHPLKVVYKNLPVKFYSETLKKPWMRMQVFLEEGPLARTPEHYKKFFYDWKVATPSPVHYIPEEGDWKKTKDGQIIPVQNIPLDLKYPRELDDGIWGGEGVIKGFRKKHKKRPKTVRFWVPMLKETVVYSVILNKHMKVQVTPRALDLIDQHYGLDSYILKTPPADLMSELALKLKREMLYTLADKTLYPEDPVKREEVYEKYKQFIIPKEELEWYGLSLKEAYRKQIKIEREEEKTGPYKEIFRQEFIQYLQEKKTEATDQEEAVEDSKKGIIEKLNKLNIFARKK